MNERAALERQRKHANPDYLLTSILRCNTCGDALYGHQQAFRRGRRVRMYRHATRRSIARLEAPACPFVHRYLKADPLETAALDATRVMLSSDEALRLARKELARLRKNAGAAYHVEALRHAESALGTTMRAAAEANARAARATTAMERRIHDETMRTLAAEADVQTTRVANLRSEAQRIAEAEARLPVMHEHLKSLQHLFALGSLAERKVVVAAVVDSMRVDYDANSVEVRVRAG